MGMWGKRVDHSTTCKQVHINHDQSHGFFVVDAAEERRRGETLPLGYALTVTEVAVRRRLVREARPVPHRRVRAAALQKSSAASSGQWTAVALLIGRRECVDE